MGHSWEGSWVLQCSDDGKRCGELGLGRVAAHQKHLRGHTPADKGKAFVSKWLCIFSYPAPISRSSVYTQAQITEHRSGRASPHVLCLLHSAGILAGDNWGSWEVLS